MESRRARLKELAARSCRLWGLMPLPDCLAGETRIETRNTLYRLRDGVCYSVHREEVAGRFDPAAFVGMRVVGWLLRDEPRAALSLEWQPGAYAVLWRPRTGPDDRSAVALTSPSIAFRRVAPSAPPPAPRPRTASIPPPLPLAIPRPGLARAPAPPDPIRELPSLSRLIGAAIPQAPETPTPRTRPAPPPLPARARAGVRPYAYRVLS